MSFFYGLVTQRGPFVETAADYLRMTQPGESGFLPDPNSSPMEIAKLQRTGRSGGGGGGGTGRYPNTKSVNGLEKDMGLSQEMINAIMNQISQEEFVGGLDGSVEKTMKISEFLVALKQSTMYGYAAGPLEAALRLRVTAMRNQISPQDLAILNFRLTGIPIKIEDFPNMQTAEMQYLDFLSKSSESSALQFTLNGLNTIREKELFRLVRDGRIILPDPQALLNEINDVSAPSTPIDPAIEIDPPQIPLPPSPIGSAPSGSSY